LPVVFAGGSFVLPDEIGVHFEYRCQILGRPVAGVVELQELDEKAGQSTNDHNQRIFSRIPGKMQGYAVGLECVPFGKGSLEFKNIVVLANPNVAFNVGRGDALFLCRKGDEQLVEFIDQLAQVCTQIFGQHQAGLRGDGTPSGGKVSADPIGYLVVIEFFGLKKPPHGLQLAGELEPFVQYLVLVIDHQNG